MLPFAGQQKTGLEINQVEDLKPIAPDGIPKIHSVSRLCDVNEASVCCYRGPRTTRRPRRTPRVPRFYAR